MMIIKVSQNGSIMRHTYSVEANNFSYSASVGAFSPFQNIFFGDIGNNFKGIFDVSDWINYIPFVWLFGKDGSTRKFNLYKNGSEYGSIALLKQGLFKKYYTITSRNAEVLDCYYLSKGSYNYVSIYYNNLQIAMIETHLTVKDNKYIHTIYLLDEYSNFADLVSFFAVYYSNFHFTRRYEMMKGTRYQKSWTYSKYNDKYNPAWLETYFPE